MPADLGKPVSNKAVDQAGKLLSVPETAWTAADEYAAAVAVVQQWRSLHARPLAMVAAEVARISGIEPVQRLKRIEAIIGKVRRVPRFAERLSSMQDIGGCRVVAPTYREARAIFEACQSQITCGAVSVKDHMNEPPASGYRSSHIICRVSPESGSQRHERCEIQIRSAAQDAWATAVETASRLAQEPLKEGRGNSDWLRLFQLMGNYIALREGATLATNAPESVADLATEITHLAGVLDVLRLLEPRVFSISDVSPFAVSPLGALGMQYVVVRSDVATSTATVATFGAQNLWEALEEYGRAERSAAESVTAQAVAVAVTNYDALLARYPAYFGATAPFIKLLREAMIGVEEPL